MRDPQFTPGPWRTEDWDDYGNHSICVHALGDLRICKAINSGDQTANAALIAAAPEMYAMLAKLEAHERLPYAIRGHIFGLLAKARNE